LFGWFPVFVQTIDGLVVVISDSGYVYTVIANMFIMAVSIGAAFGGMFIPFKTYMGTF